MNRPTIDARTLATRVVERLTSAGHQAYWAGGCVRDLLLGQIPKDFDVATSAQPTDVQRLFRRTVAIGASFGVITVIGGPGITVEVATFRSDGKYSDGRRPDHITFSSAQEDAQRRDFTINGMFFDPQREEVIDYVGGQRDLASRIVRAIGDPAARFNEDKLRLLRAIRFAGRLGFAIDPATYDALCREVASITVVSVERILAELRQMIEHVSRVRSLEMLWGSGLFPVLYPELIEVNFDDELFARSLRLLGFVEKRVSLAWGMAGLLAPIEKNQATRLARSILERQRASNEEIDRADWLVSERDLWRTWAEEPEHLVKRVLAKPGAGELLDLAEATEKGETGDAALATALRQRYAEWGSVGVDPVPLLSGKELITWGYSPGKLFKEILEVVRNEQLDGRLSSPEDAEHFVRNRWK
jgi:tRNA nucleotidyltransferase/poly(A) polymerase